MPSGESFSADKNFWVGVPNAIDVYDDPTYFYCGQMNIVNVDYGDYTYYDMGINQVNWSYQGATLANINDGFTKLTLLLGTTQAMVIFMWMPIIGAVVQEIVFITKSNVL